jgi:hypothetical protein
MSPSGHGVAGGLTPNSQEKVARHSLTPTAPTGVAPTGGVRALATSSLGPAFYCTIHIGCPRLVSPRGGRGGVPLIGRVRPAFFLREWDGARHADPAAPHHGQDTREGAQAPEWSTLPHVTKPFPFTRYWYWDRGDTTDEGTAEQVNHGSICLGSDGCGMYWHLIVTGPDRGIPWMLCGEAIQPVCPKRTFLQWYEDWLDGRDSFYGLPLCAAHRRWCAGVSSRRSVAASSHRANPGADAGSLAQAM